jgi:hypothetical protein
MGGLVLAAVLGTAPTVFAHDDSKYPDWSGQWRVLGGNRWDPTKPPRNGQNPPLTAEYQAIFEASIADQDAGGQGNDLRYKCMPAGMPRVMTAIFPFEFVILPKLTYIIFENILPRRIYTDGRDFSSWPKPESEPAINGYSIGKWIDEDGDGRYDTLEVETRNFKGPRTYENSGLQLHADNQSILKERISLDKANPDILHDEFTVIDHALTRPWITTKSYRRDRNVLWVEDNCPENNNHVVVGKENYFLSADGFLMPTKKSQPPPDLRYFNAAKKQ